MVGDFSLLSCNCLPSQALHPTLVLLLFFYCLSRSLSLFKHPPAVAALCSVQAVKAGILAGRLTKFVCFLAFKYPAVQCRSPLTSFLFLFIYCIYQTVVVFALQLIYIFVLFHPHMHEYVSFIFFFLFLGVKSCIISSFQC